MTNLPFLYPLLFAIFPLLAFYNSNIEKMKFIRIVELLEISVACTIGLWLLLNIFIKNRQKSSLLVTYFLLMFYSYGHVYNMLEGLLFKNPEGENNIGLFSFWLILLIVGGFLIIRLDKNLATFTRLICLIGIYLILISFFQIAYFNLRLNKIISPNLLTDKVDNLLNLEELDRPLGKVSSPNIYYIILDGYASNEVLKDIYGYGNMEFVDFLESKGFNLALEARSNYSQTALSLASSLNMKYINYLTEVLGENSTNKIIASDMIKNNEVLKFLKKQGYQTIHFSSGWRGGTDRNRFADVNIYCVRNNDLFTVLSLTTMFRPFENIIILRSTRERILCTFARLASISGDFDDPIFVFAHIVSPHPPFVFGSNGEVINDSKLNKANDLESWTNKEAYLNQLKFINIEVKELVGKLTSDKNNLPIIIIQADHGSASTPGMEEYNPNLIQERMRPFVASYLPGKDNFIPDSITPVNIFRLIFNNYFNTKYEVLENKVYFSTYGKPYKFIDVTDNIWKQGSGIPTF